MLLQWAVALNNYLTPEKKKGHSVIKNIGVPSSGSKKNKIFWMSVSSWKEHLGFIDLFFYQCDFKSELGTCIFFVTNGIFMCFKWYLIFELDCGICGTAPLFNSLPPWTCGTGTCSALAFQSWKDSELFVYGEVCFLAAPHHRLCQGICRREQHGFCPPGKEFAYAARRMPRMLACAH